VFKHFFFDFDESNRLESIKKKTPKLIFYYLTKSEIIFCDGIFVAIFSSSGGWSKFQDIYLQNNIILKKNFHNFIIVSCEKNLTINLKGLK
jgi:hypothetical protein